MDQDYSTIESGMQGEDSSNTEKMMDGSKNDTKHPPPSIKIFYHVFAHAYMWRSIVPDQMNKLLYSGLLMKCKVCHITIVGPQAKECAEYIESFPRVQILLDPQNQTAERVTLLRMHDLIEDDDYVLYMHSKGVTRIDHFSWVRIMDWRNLMEWYLIHSHETCLEKLSDHDVVGTNFSIHPVPHFSGNFWWIRGSYYKSLPRHIGGNYLDPEQYVLQKSCRVCTMYDSKTNHYHQRFFMTRYVDGAVETTTPS